MDRQLIERRTRYVTAVLESLEKFGHATNLDLLQDLQHDFPEVSATTVHRVSSRSCERGLIGHAPTAIDGAMRYDADPRPHHHFVCARCDRICNVPDTDKSARAIRHLKESSGECEIAGTLLLQGVCKQCYKENTY